jgi:soluble lytic murein transglycosylase-like protein
VEIPGGNKGFALAESAQLDAQKARLRTLAERPEGASETPEGLRKAAKEFESVFLNQLMKAMRSTVPENKLFNSQGATKFYQQMYDQEIAKSLAGSGKGMGVADLIVRQFERNVAGGENAAAPATDTATAPASLELIGPPAPRPDQPRPAVLPPVAADQAAARYRALGAVADRTAALARLRLMARHDSAAAADTLSRYESEMAAASRESDVPPALLLAVVMEESGGRADARSPKGAEGLMQLMPGTATEVGVDDAADPAQNLRGGAAYLARMIDRYEGRLDLALAAYNAGPGTVDRAGGQVPDYRETRDYVRKVLDRYGRLGGGTELANGD